MATLIACAVLGGCGNKGDLYLPPVAQDEGRARVPDEPPRVLEPRADDPAGIPSTRPAAGGVPSVDADADADESEPRRRRTDSR